MKLIALTGGIGSGKSTVARILRIMGHEVYDCDSRAKSLMDNSGEIKQQLVEAFGKEAVTPDGAINRPYISGIVFNDAAALSRLNAIVHPAVKRDILQWAASHAATRRQCLFVETAILKESNLADIIDEEWTVEAPTEVRIERVMRRNGLSRQAIEARIKAQSNTINPQARIIKNDSTTPLLPQLTM